MASDANEHVQIINATVRASRPKIFFFISVRAIAPHQFCHPVVSFLAPVYIYLAWQADAASLFIMVRNMLNQLVDKRMHRGLLPRSMKKEQQWRFQRFQTVFTALHP